MIPFLIRNSDEVVCEPCGVAHAYLTDGRCSPIVFVGDDWEDFFVERQVTVALYADHGYNAHILQLESIET